MHSSSSQDNIDDAWSSFHSAFMQTMSTCIPQKIVKCKSKDPPWLNSELRKLIKKKHRLFKQWKKSLKDSAYLKYKQIRNKLSNQIKYANHNFFASLLDNASPGAM